MSEVALIRLEGVTKVYQLGTVAVHALRGIDLRIDEGEYVAIMGPSGSGKSTLMNLLGCLDTPTEGSYEFRGIRVSGMSDDELSLLRNREIGFVFQTFNLLPRADARHNVELPLIYAGVDPSTRRAKALEALEMVGLGHRSTHKPQELSGGERQRVAIARALVTDPSIILADEPTGNLDSATGADVMRIFDEISRQGRTLILVTHEEEVARHARRILRLRDGRIVSDEPVAVPS